MTPKEGVLAPREPGPAAGRVVTGP